MGVLFSLLNNEFQLANLLHDLVKTKHEKTNEEKNGNGNINRFFNIVRDPIWQGAAAITAIIAFIITQCSSTAEALCEEPVFKTVTDGSLCGNTQKEVIVSPKIINTCQDSSFGISKWNQSQIITEASGWRGGGSSPVNWCNELASNFIAKRSIGGESKTTIIGKPTQSTNKDWKGHVTYNYGCTVKIEWAPVYNIKQDPICGITPAITKTINIPKSCEKHVGTKKVECSI